jgi:hypothetical protein
MFCATPFSSGLCDHVRLSSFIGHSVSVKYKSGSQDRYRDWGAHGHGWLRRQIHVPPAGDARRAGPLGILLFFPSSFYNYQYLNIFKIKTLLMK